MRGRCHSPNHKLYAYYGARGITVCERWRNSFHDFLEDMGDRPPGCTLDRIKNWLGYSPTNCRWASKATQSLNRGIFKPNKPMRNISKYAWGWQVQMRLKPFTNAYSKLFQSLEEAQEHRDLIEYEREMYRRLNKR